MFDFPAKKIEDNLISNTGYQYLPAGAVPTSNMRFVALINYHKLSGAPFKKDECITIGKSVWNVSFDLPDRKIQLLPVTEKFNPENYDEVVYFDPYDPRSRLNDQISWVLGSAHYATEKFEFPWGRPADIRVCMDSGGAQLKLGTSDFVNPVDVINTMNTSANAGFSLDIPPRLDIDLNNIVTLKTLAHLQKRNNEIFLKERRDDLVLLNVLHGTTYDEVMTWIDTVHMDGFNGWALGIDDSSDPLSGVRGAVILHEHFDDPGWLHIFGTAGPKIIPAMAWFGKLHGRVSSDSSTWFEGSRRGKYFTLDAMCNFNANLLSVNADKPEAMAGFKGRNSTDMSRVRNAGRYIKWAPGGLLPCQCNICALFKNVDALLGHYYTPLLLSLHDLLILRKFGHQWNTLAQNMEIDEFIAMTKNSMGVKSADMVEYIHIGLTSGLKCAEAQFQGGPKKRYTTKAAGLVSNNTSGRKLALFGKVDEEVDLENILHNSEVGMEEYPTENIKEDYLMEDVPNKGKFAYTNPHTRILEDDNTGRDPSIQIGPQQGKKEPKNGWPLTQEIARYDATTWAPTETTKYDTVWDGSKPIRVIKPPILKTDIDITSTSLSFPEGSNMECLLNYIDPNFQKDMLELSKIDKELPNWVRFKLVSDPDYFRMRELTSIPGMKKKRSNVGFKEQLLNDIYLDYKKAMEAGTLNEQKAWIDSLVLKKKQNQIQPQAKHNKHTKTKGN